MKRSEFDTDSLSHIEQLVSEYALSNPPQGSPVLLMGSSSRTNAMAFNTGVQFLVGWMLPKNYTQGARIVA